MAIPNYVTNDVKDMASDSEIDLQWRARRIAAVLRRYGYIETPDWIDANKQEFNAAKSAGDFDFRTGG